MNREEKTRKTWEAWHIVKKEIDWAGLSMVYRVMGWTYRDQPFPTAQDLEDTVFSLVLPLWTDPDETRTETWATTGRLLVRAQVVHHLVELRISIDSLLGQRSVE